MFGLPMKSLLPHLAEIAASPDHYLYAIEGGDAVIVPMDRAAYTRSIFLDARISPAGESALHVPIADLAAALTAAIAPPPVTAWIFHVAHCGSTLLARALEGLGAEVMKGLVLREPLALRQLAFAPDPARLSLVLAMLGRRYGGDGPTLVKANVPVNALLPAIAAANPVAPAVFLHLGLEDYALAVLRSPQHRGWMRQVAARFAGPIANGPPGPSDAACLAALWLWQMRAFAGALDAMPQACTLDAERFYADPAATLAALAPRFGRPADAQAIAALVAGPLFTSYSKRPGESFDNTARLARGAWLAQELAGEIAEARGWAEAAEPDLGALLAQIAAAALR